MMAPESQVNKTKNDCFCGYKPYGHEIGFCRIHNLQATFKHGLTIRDTADEDTLSSKKPCWSEHKRACLGKRNSVHVLDNFRRTFAITRSCIIVFRKFCLFPLVLCLDVTMSLWLQLPTMALLRATRTDGDMEI